MADEESAGGLEAVIKVTLDDSGLEGEAEAAVEKVQRAARKKVIIETEVKDPPSGGSSKRVKVKVEPVIEDGSIAAAISKSSKGRKHTVKVDADVDLSTLKMRLAAAKAAANPRRKAGRRRSQRPAPSA